MHWSEADSNVFRTEENGRRKNSQSLDLSLRIQRQTSCFSAGQRGCILPACKRESICARRIRSIIPHAMGKATPKTFKSRSFFFNPPLIFPCYVNTTPSLRAAPAPLPAHPPAGSGIFLFLLLVLTLL